MQPDSVWDTRWHRIMVAWSLVSQVFLLIQAGYIFANRSAQQISWGAYTFLGVSSLIWLGYGAVVLQPWNAAIVVNSVAALVGVTLVLVGYGLYA